MLKKFLFATTVAISLVACSSKDCCKADAAKTTGDQTAAPTANDGKHFGRMITPNDALSYDDFLVKMTTDSMPAKVSGKISAVCQAKGCWMDFVSDDASKPKMKVKFKDYAFFMPMDCAGKRAVVDGYAYTQTTSVEELKHLAGDAGKTQTEIDAINEPKKELRFMANGVVFVD
jgi:Domain of unknown function (DUF4920)